MAAGTDKLKEWTRIIILIAIIITLFFICVFAVLGAKINRLEGCGWDQTGAHPAAAVTNHSHTLDNANDFELIEFEVNTSNLLRHDFCFMVHVESADGAKLEVINEDETVLSTEFAIQGEGTYCSEVNVTDHQYIGLKCPDCGPAAEVVILEVTAGDFVVHVSQDSNALSVTSERELAYTLYSQRNCKGTLRFFMWCYLWLMIALGFMTLVLIGFKRFEQMLFEDFKL